MKLPCLDCGHELESHLAGGACVLHHANSVPILACDCHHTWQDHHAGAYCFKCECKTARFTVTGYTAARLALVCSCRHFVGPRP